MRLPKNDDRAEAGKGFVEDSCEIFRKALRSYQPGYQIEAI